MIEQTLHGLVVGLGKIRKDGSKEFHWLDKPIHNRIVSGGLDYCLTYNGSNSDIKTTSSYEAVVSMFRRGRTAESSSYQFNWSGCIQFMSVGTNGDATAFTDVGLKSQVGEYSESSAYYVVPYMGMKLNKTGNIVNYRFNYKSVAMSEPTTIREIGFHGKYYGQQVYPMFSRVVLPESIELNTDESLIVVYQMNVAYAGKNEEIAVDASLLSGLVDSDGNPLRAVKTMPFSALDNRYYDELVDGSSFTLTPFYSVNTNSSGPVKDYSDIGNFSSCRITVPWEVTNYPTTRNSVLPYSLNPNYRYPKYGEFRENDYNQFVIDTNSIANSEVTVKDYVPGTYYRDIVYTLHPAWPKITTESYQDIYAINVRGLVFRFGYYDNSDPDNPVWVPKPWRKQFGQSYKFTFRYKLSTADTV